MMSTADFMGIWITTSTLIKRLRRVVFLTVELSGSSQVRIRHSSDPKLLDEAAHGYEFLKEYCIDREYGGIYWSMNYDGSPKDTTKHTYNQAFSIYALSAYYEASGDSEALAGLAAFPYNRREMY